MSGHNEDIAKELAEKAKKLEHAAINLAPEEIAKTCAKLGKLEYTARALGIACRFRGVECVKALVKGGASFHAPLTNYMVQTYGSYGDDLSVLLLNSFPTKTIPYFVVVPQICKSVTREDGTKLSPLPFEKRVEVLDYLCENADRVEFDAGELLYFAIMLGDESMTRELEKRGAEFSEYRKEMLTVKGKPKDLYIWTGLLERLSADNFISVLTRIVERLGVKKLHCTNGIYDACFDKLYSFENLEFYSNNFDVPKVNKTDIMKNAINKNCSSGLEFAVRDGWLKTPKKRDEMIAYAAEKKSAECSAYLLDFKNRTADFVAEREKAEKKADRELNAAPDSVIALKQIWNYKKREDGTIIITNYKGSQTKIVVPAKIGRSAVTSIAKEAFSPFHDRVCHGRDFFKTITEITLPDCIVEIGERAFNECHALRAVNIPEGVAEIKSHAFADCFALESIVIPCSVKIIGDFAFFGCESLKTLVIPEGVERIGKLATCQCRTLETVELPRSLKSITEGTSASDSLFYFSTHLKNIIVPRGSYAEEYCKKYGIRYTYKEDV